VPESSLETAHRILKGDPVTEEAIREMANNFVQIVDLIDSCKSYLELLEGALGNLPRL